MNRHIKSEHEGIVYPCNQCDYKAKQNSQLKSHKKSRHSQSLILCEQPDQNESVDTWFQFKQPLLIKIKCLKDKRIL